MANFKGDNLQSHIRFLYKSILLFNFFKKKNIQLKNYMIWIDNLTTSQSSKKKKKKKSKKKLWLLDSPFKATISCLILESCLKLEFYYIIQNVILTTF